MFSRQAHRVASRSLAIRSTPTIVAASSSGRTYATAATPQNTKPPVALYGIDGTYASALYTAAAKSSSLDTTSRALSALADVFKRDAKLPAILHAPTLSASDKKQIVQELRRHIGSVAGGSDGGPTVANFLQTLADNNRLGILAGVCDKFAVLMGAARGEVEMVVTSAQKLDAKMLQRLEAAVAKSEYSQGKKLKVIPKVNPDIMGGLVVEIGDRTIDLSVSSKISKMNKLLTDAL